VRILIVSAWILVAAPLALAQLTTPAGKPGSVDGIVTNSVTRDPLRKAIVTLQSTNGSSAQATTDAAGHFHFDKVEPGTFSINANREGFMSAGRQLQAVKVGEEENVKDLAVVLLPLAHVSGHVFDEDGDPIMLASVQALHYGYNQGRKTLMPGAFATSNDLGEFEFSGLEPGKYFFVANARPPVQNLPPRTRIIGQLMAYPPTFYPSAADVAQATPSQLAPGATISNIDFHLRKVPAFRVSGKLLDATGQPARNASMNLLDVTQGIRNSRGTLRVMDDGSFNFPVVVPGTYLLTATVFGEFAAEQITVADEHLDGITLALSHGISISGRFSAEGPAPPQISGNVNGRPSDGYGQLFASQPQQDGTFTMENVQPGSYFLDVYGDGNVGYVKSIRFGATDISSGELTITQGSTGPLNIVLGTDGGQVQGTIQTALGAPATTGTVSLVPAADLPGRHDLIKETETDDEGNFKFQNISPGEYKVFAWEESARTLIYVPEFRKALESHAASVSVQPNGKETVQVQIIPADDVETAKNKLQ